MFKKISEWIEAGNMKTGFYVIDHKIERETEKAIGFICEKYNSYGNLKPAVCWFPKTKLKPVENDFYTTLPADRKVFLIPDWLYSAKSDEGFLL